MATSTPEELDAFRHLIDAPQDSHVVLILAVEIPIVTLMTLAIVLRLFIRTRLRKTIGWDDILMGIAAVSPSSEHFNRECLVLKLSSCSP
jgi:DNA mismatch repair protein MutH